MRKNRVILCYPKIYDHEDWHRPPLSLMAIARMIEHDFNVDILDERIDDTVPNRIERSMHEILCIAITALTGNQIKHAIKIAKFVKDLDASIPIVWGGWHPSIMPEQTAMHSCVDYVVRGQGEITFKELSLALSHNRPLDGILGLTYKNDGKILSNPDRPFHDINEFPSMPYHLVDVEKYVGKPMASSVNARILSYVSSQGCPHRCAFCSDARVYKRRWSGLAAHRVVEDLSKLVEENRIQGFYFEDSNFFANLKRVRAICKGIIQRGLKIEWEAEVRTEQFIRADKELKKLVKESGCYRLLVGAESGSQEVLDMLNKDATVHDTIAFVKQAKEYGIIPWLSLMVGLPGIKDEIKKTMKLVRDIKLFYPQARILVFFYTPYPGTKLYDVALQMGLKEPTSIEEWSRYTLDKIQTPWISKRHRNLCRNIRFYTNTADNLAGSPSISPLLRFFKIRSILSILSRLRLRSHCYSLPIERILADIYLTLCHRKKYYL